MLFQDIIYGPIHSRRLGVSLGVNVMPTNGKVCSFDCCYCECGGRVATGSTAGALLPDCEQYAAALEAAQERLAAEGTTLDVITFSGNGEPTLHPLFERIMELTVMWRDRHHKKAKICVLSNSTQLHRPDVVRALWLADKRIMKLDSGIDATMRLIDRPHDRGLSVEDIMERLEVFGGDFTLQTCFLRGSVEGVPLDNSSDEEVEAWLGCVKRLMPQEVMIYVIDRPTPFDTLEKISAERMALIAERVREIGIENISVSV